MDHPWQLLLNYGIPFMRLLSFSGAHPFCFAYVYEYFPPPARTQIKWSLSGIVMRLMAVQSQNVTLDFHTAAAY